MLRYKNYDPPVGPREKEVDIESLQSMADYLPKMGHFWIQMEYPAFWGIAEIPTRWKGWGGWGARPSWGPPSVELDTIVYTMYPGKGAMYRGKVFEGGVGPSVELDTIRVYPMYRGKCT